MIDHQASQRYNYRDNLRILLVYFDDILYPSPLTSSTILPAVDEPDEGNVSLVSSHEWDPCLKLNQVGRRTTYRTYSLHSEHD